MKIKVKKKNKDGIVKLETSGNLQELILKEDFLKKSPSPILLCFRGKDSSGIIELDEKELEELEEEIKKRKLLLAQSKILKFKK